MNPRYPWIFSYKIVIDRGFEPMNPFTGLSLESSCFNHLHKRNVQLDIDIPSLYKFMSNFIQFRNLCPRTIGSEELLTTNYITYNYPSK